MARAFLIVIAAYVLAGAAAIGTSIVFHTLPPLVKEVIWLSFLVIPPVVLRADVDTHAP